MLVWLGIVQEVFSVLKQISKRMCMGPGVALFEKLNCSVLDTTLFNGLGEKKGKKERNV